MSYYDPQLVQQIQEQAPSEGYEEALLLGSYYETSIGTNPATWSQQGVPDPTWSSPSFGPFMWHYNVGALNDLMQQNNWTEQQAIDYVTTPAGGVSAALQRYMNIAQAQGIDPNQSPEAAMQLATAAEVGVGEQNALSSGSWQDIYQQYVEPLIGAPGNQPLTGTPSPAQPNAQLTAAKTGTTATTGTDPVTSILMALDRAMNPAIVKAGWLGTLENIFLPTKWQGDIRDFIEMNLSRLGFAAGFTVLGVVGAMKFISGGRLGGRDLPGLIAGFVAGPEAGAINLASKFGISGLGQAQAGQRSQARIGLAQERFAFQQSQAQQRGAAQAQRSAFRQQQQQIRLTQSQQRIQQRDVSLQQQQARGQAAQAQFAVREGRLQAERGFRESQEPGRVSRAERALGLSAGRLEERRRENDIKAFRAGLADWFSGGEPLFTRAREED